MCGGVITLRLCVFVYHLCVRVCVYAAECFYVVFHYMTVCVSAQVTICTGSAVLHEL